MSITKPHWLSPGIDVHACLERWARWARDGLSGVGWPSETLLAKVIEHGALGAAHRHYGGVPLECDDLIAWTETAIMRLNLEERNVIVRVYLNWEPPEVSAKALGLTQGTFDSRLSRARRSIRDFLEGRMVALQEKSA